VLAKQAKRIWWQIGAGAVVLLLVLGIPYLVLYGDILVAASQLPEARRQAKEAGFPLRADEVAPSANTAEHDNAGPLIKQVGHELHWDPVLKPIWKQLTDANLPSTPDRPSHLTPGQALPILDKLKPVADKLYEAARRPACDFGNDWSLDYGQPYPEMVELKAAIQMLATRARFRAMAGRMDDALEDLRVCLKICAHVRRTPLALHQNVATATEGIIFGGYEQLLTVAGKDRTVLQAIRKDLDLLVDLPEIWQLFRTEMWFEISPCRKVRTLAALMKTTDVSKYGRSTEFWGRQDYNANAPTTPSTLLSRAQEARVLQRWVEVHRRYPDSSRPKEICEFIDGLSAKLKSERGLSYRLPKLMLYPDGQVADIYDFTNARRNCMRALLSLLEYEADHGEFPMSLSAAGNGFDDPFGGGQLVYERNGAKCKVYSVGRDQVDDGGMAVVPGEKPKGDLVMRYPVVLIGPKLPPIDPYAPRASGGK